jgi:hypothetical protein
MVAHAFLTVMRAQGIPSDLRKKGEGLLPELDCIQTQPGTVMPLTVPEVRRLLEKVLWQQVVPLIHVWAWSYWRRRHQAIAQFHHYRKRLLSQ